MHAACLICGLGLTMCLFKITSSTQGTTSLTLAPREKKRMTRSNSDFNDYSQLWFGYWTVRSKKGSKKIIGKIFYSQAKTAVDRTVMFLMKSNRFSMVFFWLVSSFVFVVFFLLEGETCRVC